MPPRTPESMTPVQRARLRSHLLSAPASTVTDAATHMLAVQSQDFGGGRWALAARTADHPGRSDVDGAFERGELVRTWTQRGTLHIVAAADLAWILPVTAGRQLQAAAGIHRAYGIDDTDLGRAERAVRTALAGGNRLTRAEFADVLAGAGIETTASRANHLLSALAVRAVLALGPVVPRESGPTREQYLVAVDDLPAGRTVTDPLAELLVAYLRSHGPATLADFRWWVGLPQTAVREAAATAGDRIAPAEEAGMFVGTDAGDAAAAVADGADRVRALPPWDEYYLSYADRSRVCAPERMARVGPSANGMVKPVLVAGGEVVGTWSHSTAVGKHHLPPVAAAFEEEASVDATDALAEYARFLAS
ncbi:winged helix DNA-binding domain-containing protein [Microbacterium sp. 179-B 1A2 NHS]|uniref:winged helix DNA-binding domain-containing protein n=1 Tax=Microbacterium sp. 179-B 1A2 NHS TaxID=3142383 RepID=UPI00399EF935